MKKDTAIEYGYLDLDSNKFYSSYEKFINSLPKNSTLRCVTSYEHNQILYGACTRDFTELELILRCRKLTGVL